MKSRDPECLKPHFLPLGQTKLCSLHYSELILVHFILNSGHLLRRYGQTDISYASFFLQLFSHGDKLPEKDSKNRISIKKCLERVKRWYQTL